MAPLPPSLKSAYELIEMMNVLCGKQADVAVASACCSQGDSCHDATPPPPPPAAVSDAAAGISDDATDAQHLTATTAAAAAAETVTEL